MTIKLLRANTPAPHRKHAEVAPGAIKREEARELISFIVLVCVLTVIKLFQKNDF